MQKTTIFCTLLCLIAILSTSLSLSAQNKSSQTTYHALTTTKTMSSTAASAIADSDGDGIKDNVDEDDDNDGISDAIEEEACAAIASSTITEFIFLNETFGVHDLSDDSTARGEIGGADSPYTAYTGYGYEDGDASNGNVIGDNSVNDGEYTLTGFIVADGGTSSSPNDVVTPTGAVATWASKAWEPIEDHTPDDNIDGVSRGRMALFNGATIPDNTFYETTITGLIPNVPITYSFAAINIDNKTFDKDKDGIDVMRSQPDITVNF